MARTRKSKARRKRKKKLVKQTKGYRWDRSKKYRAAKEALLKALRYAYRDRKVRKREKRRLWQVRINAAVRDLGLTYSDFIHRLKKNNIQLDRKVLSRLASEKPKIFEKIVKEVK